MGLLCEFDVIDDFGFLDMTEEYAIVPDYSEGCQVFVNTFLSVARQLVPIDTGYLNSTLNASCDDTGCWAETDCEYAQYPEFGTWCQAAQPYFTPAVEEAILAAEPYWVRAESDALEEEQRLIQEEMEQLQMANFEMRPLTREEVGIHSSSDIGILERDESSSHFGGYYTSTGHYSNFDSYMDNHYMPALNSVLSVVMALILGAIQAIISSLFGKQRGGGGPRGQVYIPDIIIT